MIKEILKFSFFITHFITVFLLKRNQNLQTGVVAEYQFYEGNISEQIKVFRKFERNLKTRENLKEAKKDTTPCDPLVIHCTRQSLVMD